MWTHFLVLSVTRVNFKGTEKCVQLTQTSLKSIALLCAACPRWRWPLAPVVPSGGAWSGVPGSSRFYCLQPSQRLHKPPLLYEKSLSAPRVDFVFYTLTKTGQVSTFLKKDPIHSGQDQGLCRPSAGRDFSSMPRPLLSLSLPATSP